MQLLQGNYNLSDPSQPISIYTLINHEHNLEEPEGGVGKRIPAKHTRRLPQSNGANWSSHTVTELNTKIENIHQDFDPLKASIGDLTKKLNEIEQSQQLLISSQHSAVMTTIQEVKKQNKSTDNWIQQTEKCMTGLSKGSNNIEAKLDEL